MAAKTQARPLDKRETSTLIGSDKVEGTPVCRLNGDIIGEIERVMIDKISGKVAYVVMSFGGFLVWVKTTIHCRGPSSHTILSLAVMRSSSLSNS